MRKHILKLLQILCTLIVLVLCIHALLLSNSFAEAPAALIAMPNNNGIFSQYDDIVFQGGAYYTDDVDRKAKELIWTSNIDGVIGTGEQFTKTLSGGNHIITLKAVDIDSTFTTDKVSIVVE